MSGAALTFQFDDGPIRLHLARLALLHASGYDRARREIGEYFKGEIQAAFDHQKLYDGKPMPQSKAAAKRSGKTLIHHHHLYDSYTYNLVTGGVEIGSGSFYAAIHHFGGETGRPGHRFTMQARPVMGMTDEHDHAIGEIFIKEIRQAQGG